MSAKECKSAKRHKRAQKGAKEHKRALPRKSCKQPGLKQPGLGTPKNQEPKRTNIARTAPKKFLNNWRGLPGHYPVNKGRQIAPESSPERSAKALSHSFLVVPFLSLGASKVTFEVSLKVTLKVTPKSDFVTLKVTQKWLIASKSHFWGYL